MNKTRDIVVDIIIVIWVVYAYYDAIFNKSYALFLTTIPIAVVLVFKIMNLVATMKYNASLRELYKAKGRKLKAVTENLIIIDKASG